VVAEGRVRTGVRRCDAPSTQQLVEAILRAAGSDPDIALEVARHLVRSNLSGHDSHGVIRVPQYVDRIERGELAPNARPTFIARTDVTALIDGNRGFGHVATAFALEWAMTQARACGLAAAAIRHCTHMGRLGEFTERAAEAGLIAMLTVGAAGPGVGGMFLHGGKQRFLGANPWSFGVPAGDRSPMIVDASSSMIAQGKVAVARAYGSALPPGCIYDVEGRPTTDPEDFYNGGGLVPLGGEVAGHKGYGLALTSALIGGLSMIDDSHPTLIGASVEPGFEEARGQIAGLFLIVVNPTSFGKPESYHNMVDDTLSAIKNSPPAPNVAEAMVPGEPEARSREERLESGFELPVDACRQIEAIAERYRVTPPAGWATS
jgi:LDH2 family malate/lactate/ureidoglycolate dehydrogenase